LGRRRAGGIDGFVHLGLFVTTGVSLVFEPVLTVHIVVGLIFAALVLAHLGQHRRGLVIGRKVAARPDPEPPGTVADLRWRMRCWPR
jgi:hypothetical protein